MDTQSVSHLVKKLASLTLVLSFLIFLISPVPVQLSEDYLKMSLPPISSITRAPEDYGKHTELVRPTWFSHDTLNTTFHSGDLVIEGNETYVIENVIFCIKGNIFVRDNAKLVIRNAHVIVNDTYKNEFFVDLFDKGTLIVEDSILETTLKVPSIGGRMMGNLLLRLHDNAVLIMKNSFSYWRIGGEEGSAIIDSSIVPDIWVGSSYINISNSEIHHGIVLRFEERAREDIELVGLNPDILSLCLKWGKSTLRIKHCKVASWMIDLTEAFKRNLIIKHSTMELIQLVFSEHVNITGIVPGHFDYWNIHQFVQGHKGWSLTLINTTVNGWKLITLNNAYIENVECILDPWLDKIVIVKDSKLTAVDARGCKLLKFMNCTVSHLMLTYQPMHLGGSGNFIIEFENSILQGYIEVAARYVFFKGTVSFRLGGHAWHLHAKLPLENVNFQKGVLIREFSLAVKDEDGKPISNASIRLYSPEGVLISDKVTDQNGFTSFNITFTKENYNKKWTLVVVSGNMTFSEEVGFLTNTPIVFSFQEIREKVKDAISYAEDVMDWVARSGKKINLDEARSLLTAAKTKYSEGKLDESLKLAEEIVELLWIKTDGLPDDWEGITPLAVDPKGDATNPGGDIKSLYAITDGRYLHLMIEVYNRKPVPEIFSIDLKTDRLGEYAIREIKRSQAILINQIGKQEQYPIDSGCDKVIEIKVPLKYIGSPEIIQIGVYTDTDIMEPFWNTLSRLSSLSISVLPTNVIMGKTVTVSGSISPPHNNVSIMLIYKLPSGTILTRNVTSTALGGFKDIFTPKMAGSWTVKARWAGDLDHEGAESSEVSFMVLKPAKFCVTDLSIAPTEVKVGEIITISVNVTNTGDVIGTFTVALWVNSSIEATRNVTLAGGESMIVTFKLTKDVPGTYNIEVAGLKGTILVKQKPPPWELYATIAAGTIIAVSTAIIAYRKKRKPPMRESGIKEV